MSEHAPATVFGYQCEKCKEFHWMMCIDTEAICGKVIHGSTGPCGGKLVYDGLYELVKQNGGDPA